ncbi:chalcone isomerase family protein [Castellaniella caeni]|uniref:chalcone isomerase family protein n=1 Tax=Castellaniella caeni TaxID=266123 RepID=UPI00082E154D|nr:chalcone isomerase family protein [Castellaniella caeni]
MTFRLPSVIFNALPRRPAASVRQDKRGNTRQRATTAMRETLLALTLAGAALGLSPAAQAVTVGTVNVPEQQTVDGQALVLNGAGLRQRFVFHIYVAALYRPQPTHDVEAILKSSEPQLLRLTLLRDINSKALTDALNDGLKANNSEAELAAMGATIKAFEAFMQTGGEGASGDLVDIVFQQGKVAVTFKGKALGEVNDPRFATALLKVWLGSTPAQESLKLALLGQKSANN